MSQIRSFGRATPSYSLSARALESDAPTVDLGYARYRAIAVNNTGQYYNFSNIRYAAPPLGDLRWRAPQDPLEDHSTVQSGSLGYICPQAPASWFTEAFMGLGNLSAVLEFDPSSQAESEDCLFLDVIAPIDTFRNGQTNYTNTSLAPVLFNIPGGGFFIGEKRALYPPNGLLEAANNSFVYVSINYRLGAFGFLSHLKTSDVNASVSNAGLLDQRQALKWVQKYIHLFGGDANQVTIIGESAGGASVMAHTIAYGGEKETNLFARGIAQSPATSVSDPVYQELGANLFLRYAGVSNLRDARNLSTEVLQSANKKAQNATPVGVLYFGMAIDGNFIKAIPPVAYAKGAFVKNVSLIAGYNKNEARFVDNQNTGSNIKFNETINALFPSATSALRDYIITDLYPANYNGSFDYSTAEQRYDLAIKEYLISCNAVAIANAYNNRTHNYIFTIPPAIHAQDLAYTYNPTHFTPDFYQRAAQDLQSYLVSFILTGNPNARTSDLPAWPEFEANASAIAISPNGIVQTTIDAANSRCGFWNSGSYLGVQSETGP